MAPNIGLMVLLQVSKSESSFAAWTRPVIVTAWTGCHWADEGGLLYVAECPQCYYFRPISLRNVKTQSLTNGHIFLLTTITAFDLFEFPWAQMRMEWGIPNGHISCGFHLVRVCASA